MNDNPLALSAENTDRASLDRLLTDPQLADSGDLMRRRETAHLLKLLSSPHGFDLFRGVDNEMFLQGSEGCRCVGVVSAKGREGRTSISILLAVLTAAYGPRQRVLLVDATLGGNGPSRYFNLQTTGSGLGAYCLEDASFTESVSTTTLENLDVVTDDGGSRGAAKLSQDGFSRFLQEARKRYQLVVVDTPPSNQNRDVYSIARLVDAVILVVRCGYLTREQIQPFVKVLQEHKIPILGSVLNRRIFPTPSFLYGN